MVADLREMQENQWVSEIWIDKLEFVKEDYSNIPQYFYLHHKK